MLYIKNINVLQSIEMFQYSISIIKYIVISNPIVILPLTVTSVTSPLTVTSVTCRSR